MTGATSEVICRTFGLFGPRGAPQGMDHLRSGAMITLLAGIAGSYWFYSRNRSDYLQRRMREVQRHANEARLKLLETQLEPHMLFNTLANLRALIAVARRRLAAAGSAGQRHRRCGPARQWRRLRPGAGARAPAGIARQAGAARRRPLARRRPGDPSFAAAMNPTAVIAEDEPLLAQALQAELARAWPELRVLQTFGDGAAAVDAALAHRPGVLFFDIRMPGLGGLEAAAELADAWPAGQPFPALVFVTAYDQFALNAFEAQAVDYIVKPVQPARLQKAVERLRQVLAQRQARGGDLEATLVQLRQLLQAAPATSEAPLKVTQASVGTAIRVVPLEEVIYLEAADKYVRVVCEQGEVLIRTPLKELVPRLDAQPFWQVHRGTVVRATAIAGVHRDESGKMHLQLKGRSEKLPVTRLYQHLFRPM